MACVVMLKTQTALTRAWTRTYAPTDAGGPASDFCERRLNSEDETGTDS